MNCPIDETMLKNSAPSKLWKLDHQELGSVVLSVQKAGGCVEVSLTSPALSMSIQISEYHGQGWRVMSWQADTHSGQISHAQVGLSLCLDFVFRQRSGMDTLVLERTLRFLLPRSLGEPFGLDRNAFYNWFDSAAGSHKAAPLD